MAEFENGLPSEDTDMRDKKVSEVVIQKDDAESTTQQTVQAFNILVDDTQSISKQTVQAVNISTQPTGKNTVLFYL